MSTQSSSDGGWETELQSPFVDLIYDCKVEIISQLDDPTALFALAYTNTEFYGLVDLTWAKVRNFADECVRRGNYSVLSWALSDLRVPLDKLTMDLASSPDTSIKDFSRVFLNHLEKTTGRRSEELRSGFTIVGRSHSFALLKQALAIMEDGNELAATMAGVLMNKPFDMAGKVMDLVMKRRPDLVGPCFNTAFSKECWKFGRLDLIKRYYPQEYEFGTLIRHLSRNEYGSAVIEDILSRDPNQVIVLASGLYLKLTQSGNTVAFDKLYGCSLEWKPTKALFGSMLSAAATAGKYKFVRHLLSRRVVPKFRLSHSLVYELFLNLNYDPSKSPKELLEFFGWIFSYFGRAFFSMLSPSQSFELFCSLHGTVSIELFKHLEQSSLLDLKGNKNAALVLILNPLVDKLRSGQLVYSQQVHDFIEYLFKELNLRALIQNPENNLIVLYDCLEYVQLSNNFKFLDLLFENLEAMAKLKLMELYTARWNEKNAFPILITGILRSRMSSRVQSIPIILRLVSEFLVELKPVAFLTPSILELLDDSTPRIAEPIMDLVVQLADEMGVKRVHI